LPLTCTQNRRTGRRTHRTCRASQFPRGLQKLGGIGAGQPRFRSRCSHQIPGTSFAFTRMAYSL
jgi:hypothetical protein